MPGSPVMFRSMGMMSLEYGVQREALRGALCCVAEKTFLECFLKAEGQLRQILKVIDLNSKIYIVDDGLHDGLGFSVLLWPVCCLLSG